MLICEDCVNYFLGCSVSSYPIGYGLCELCGNETDCYDVHIPKKKTNGRKNIHTPADILRETVRMLYYPDIDKNDGLELADHTIRKVSGRTPEELSELVLQKEAKDK